jgi:hypothetical protein
MDAGLVQTVLGPRTDGAPHGRRISRKKKNQNGVPRKSKNWCVGRNERIDVRSQPSKHVNQRLKALPSASNGADVCCLALIEGWSDA